MTGYQRARGRAIVVASGCSIVNLGSWDKFQQYVLDHMADFHSFVWRGQRCDSWPLQSTLDRHLVDGPKRKWSDIAQRHLERFKMGANDRRDRAPQPFETDNDMWALGQHHGLATPLLDWTLSPFVGVYFAFAKTDKSQTARRAIFGFDRARVEEKSREIMRKQVQKDVVPDIVDFVRPLSNENPRLVSQGGLFTRARIGVTIDEWVSKHFPEERARPVLVKVTVPDRERVTALRALNQMNINHQSLFPDLYGVSVFCNTALRIKNYSP